jgi:outer membrane receptor for ferrienterochelin and colicins
LHFAHGAPADVNLPVRGSLTTMTIRTAWVAGMAAIVLLVSGRARAQTQPPPTPISDITLEQLTTVEVNTVFGASRYLQRVTDAPSAVTIVTHEEIERFGYQTLADVLRGVRGFYVSYDHNYTYLGVRGFSRPGDYNSRVLVLIDGHRYNETIYDLAYFGTEFPLSTEMIDRVEVVRGPGSSIYGTSAFFAVINVITKKAAGIPSPRVSVSGGSLKTGGADASFGHETAQGMQFVGSASVYGSQGIATFRVPAVGTSHDMDTDAAWTLYGSATRGRWSLSALGGSRDKRIPTGAFGIVIDDRRSQTHDQRAYLDLTYDGDMRGTSVLWRTAYDYAAYQGTYVNSPENGGVFDDGARADWWSTDVTLTRRVAQRHFLTGGGEYRDNFRQDQYGGYVDPYALTLDLKQSSQVGALFAQDEYTVSKRLSVTAGIRQDWSSTSDASTNVRLAAIIKPIAEASLKVLYGTAFRAPNPYELYYFPNPNGLLPERIRTAEVIWEQYAQRRFRMSVSGFLYHAHDLITQVPVESSPGEFIFANVEEAEAAGMELEAEGAWRGGIHTLASYTYQNVRNYPDHTRLSNSPRNLFRTQVTGPIVPRLLFFGAEGLYTGDRLTIRNHVAQGAFIGNLTLTTRQVSRAKVSVTIGNLLNQKYVDPGAEEHPCDVIQQQGRTVRAKLTWRF